MDECSADVGIGRGRGFGDGDGAGPTDRKVRTCRHLALLVPGSMSLTDVLCQRKDCVACC